MFLFQSDNVERYFLIAASMGGVMLVMAVAYGFFWM